MSIESELGKDLVLYKTFDDKITITLKAKKYTPFIAQVRDFNFKEDEDRVIFKRAEETIFPNDN